MQQFISSNKWNNTFFQLDLLDTTEKKKQYKEYYITAHLWPKDSDSKDTGT